MSQSRTVDLVIPVYGNVPVLSRCLTSVLEHRTAAIRRIIVVDDASPDRETVAYLESLQKTGAIEVISHAENRGVVAANNTGVAASDGDVVLLNNDTEVHGDWADRLLRCAYSSADIGTVTPFSNEGSICSYPYTTWWSGLPESLTLAELDALFTRANPGEVADIPTGVSFCMLVKRRCLNAVGLFDVDRYGRGYGDETDFCQRASALGWRNVVAADTFVYHQAGSSFGPGRQARAEAADRVLESLYAGYGERVRQFVLADTLAVFRQRVDLGRVARSPGHAAAVVKERAAEKAWLLEVARTSLAAVRHQAAAIEMPAQPGMTGRRSRLTRLADWARRRR